MDQNHACPSDVGLILRILAPRQNSRVWVGNIGPRNGCLWTVSPRAENLCGRKLNLVGFEAEISSRSERLQFESLFQ